ncbi:MAG: hypothetical protein DCC65_14640 [Planctomycetota bacterium]|nr:MAG: hypothetical protein DCC65_14640 [Planctomycetota bacterium]
MTRTVRALYENGVLKPLDSLGDLADHSHVRVTVESVETPAIGFAGCVGILSDQDADEMSRIIATEFEKVDDGEW